MTARHVFRLSGNDTRSFLQGLVTNDVMGVDKGLVYAALLTPQGKYLADFFLIADGDDILLDADAAQSEMLRTRLGMYKLRANVTLEDTDLFVHRGLGDCPEDGRSDPRHPALGWRAYRVVAQEESDTDWTTLYVAHVVPQTGIELTSDTFILEMGFEALNGVDFRKGCYVGQEVTARMKHKTTLRKGLVKVLIQGDAAPGADIKNGDKSVGILLSRTADAALAYLRFDRANGPMQAGEATVIWNGGGN